MLNPELSGIRAHANPDGSLPRYEQPDIKPAEVELARPKQPRDTLTDIPPYTPVHNAPYTTDNTQAVPELLAEILAQDV